MSDAVMAVWGGGYYGSCIGDVVVAVWGGP